MSEYYVVKSSVPNTLVSEVSLTFGNLSDAMAEAIALRELGYTYVEIRDSRGFLV